MKEKKEGREGQSEESRAKQSLNQRDFSEKEHCSYFYSSIWLPLFLQYLLTSLTSNSAPSICARQKLEAEMCKAKSGFLLDRDSTALPK